jgi:hypothetical protein
MDRRSFLKRAGAAALAVVAAPLFIPSERLEFGVPKARALLVPEPETLKLIGGEVSIYLPAEDWDEPNQVKTPRRGPVTLAEAAQFYQPRGESALTRLFAEQSPVLASLPFQKMPGLYGNGLLMRYLPNLDRYMLVEPGPLTRAKRELFARTGG